MSRPARSCAHLVDDPAREVAEPHRLLVQRLAVELRQPQQVGDQPVHVRRAGIHVLQQPAAFVGQVADVIGEQ